MNPRTLLSHLGKAAAVTISPSILGASPLPRSTDYSLAPPADILNGSSLLRFYKGDSGLALELCHPADRTIAAINYPVRVFYDRRGNSSETDVAFTSAGRVGEGLVATAELTDARHNRWSVKLTVDKWKAEGFRCQFHYELLEGEAKNVFFSTWYPTPPPP